MLPCSSLFGAIMTPVVFECNSSLSPGWQWCYVIVFFTEQDHGMWCVAARENNGQALVLLSSRLSPQAIKLSLRHFPKITSGSFARSDVVFSHHLTLIALHRLQPSLFLKSFLISKTIETVILCAFPLTLPIITRGIQSSSPTTHHDFPTTSYSLKPRRAAPRSNRHNLWPHHSRTARSQASRLCGQGDRLLSL